MRTRLSHWKVVVTAICITAIFGAALFWYARKKAEERRLIEDAQSCRVRAEHGDAISQQELAQLYYQGKGVTRDYGEAFHWYLQSAGQGDARAEYGLGYLYDRGEGISQDCNEALRWYRKSADAGDRRAQYAVGLMFYNGRCVTRDYAEAVPWFRKAADQGLAKAQYDLGYMYDHGQGVSQDRAEGNRWLHKAADQGNQDAQRALGTGLTIGRKLELSIQFFGGIFLLLISFLAWKGGRWGPPMRIALVAGALCILAAGLSWYGYAHYMVRCLHCGLNLFTGLKWTLDAVVVAMLAYFVWPRKRTLD
jgi:TPR repeat protein